MTQLINRVRNDVVSIGPRNNATRLVTGGGGLQLLFSSAALGSKVRLQVLRGDYAFQQLPRKIGVGSQIHECLGSK
jgi:hypothetical protein